MNQSGSLMTNIEVYRSEVIPRVGELLRDREQAHDDVHAAS
jgi:hypothetical protein